MGQAGQTGGQRQGGERRVLMKSHVVLPPQFSFFIRNLGG
jgi:hypothetical protein